MSKITTEDCAKAVVANFPAEYGSDNDNWKRISKSGKKGEPILRLFYHRALPLQATVTEVNGAIVSTTYKGLATWDVEPDSPNAAAVQAMYQTNACWEFIRAHDLFSPSAFAFYVCSEEEAEESGDVWYFLTPVAGLKHKDYNYTGHLEDFVQRHLPADHGEMEECTFVSDVGREETRALLLARGFICDSKFEAQMSGQSVEDGDGEDD